MSLNLYRLTLSVLFLLACSGCVRESTKDLTTTVSYELWVPLAVFFGGIGAGVLGWFLRNILGRIAWAALFAGPGAAIVLAPAFLTDRAVIDDKKFFMNIGMWGLAKQYELEFADVTQANLTSEEKSGRRGRKYTVYYLSCATKSGTPVQIPLSNQIAEKALPYLAEALVEHGVEINDFTTH